MDGFMYLEVGDGSNYVDDTGCYKMWDDAERCNESNNGIWSSGTCECEAGWSGNAEEGLIDCSI